MREMKKFSINFSCWAIGQQCRTSGGELQATDPESGCSVLQYWFARQNVFLQEQ